MFIFQFYAQVYSEKKKIDFLAIGKIQPSDKITLLTNFRICKYACTADLEKNVKANFSWQISIGFTFPLVFRFFSNEPLKNYRSTTVTFHMSNAPYIAIKEIAEHNKMSHLRASSTFLFIYEIIGIYVQNNNSNWNCANNKKCRTV